MCSAQITEQAHMRPDPVGQRLRVGRFRIGEARGAQYCNKVRLTDAASKDAILIKAQAD